MRRVGGTKASGPGLEDIFFSRPATRILLHLIRVEMDSESNLIRVARTNHRGFHRNISVLMGYGIVLEKRFGRIRLYMMNKDSPYYYKLKKIHSIWYFE